MKSIVRKICYITGTRADFGLMRSTLKAINENSNFELVVIVTGMHLSKKFGNTINEIVDSGLNIISTLPVDFEKSTGEVMAKNLAKILEGCINTFINTKPDIVLLLGDRGEMLAAAIAAIHLNIPIAHIHGGERSGTIDEPIRHAISKLSHIHFVSSKSARTRLIRMGEEKKRIFISGAPGLDGLIELANISRKELCKKFFLNPDRPIALLVFHPVLQDENLVQEQIKIILKECLRHKLQIVALMPNSDGGSDQVRKVLESFKKHKDIRLNAHIPRKVFVSWVAECDFMIGNSSSGIIEAGTFGTPVINIGSRQNLRDRNVNVIDVTFNQNQIDQGIKKALKSKRFELKNIYGNGNAAKIIINQLSNLDLSDTILYKANTY